MSRYGVKSTFVDLSDINLLKEALKPETRVVYMETPANPSMKIIDIKAVCDAVHGFNPNITVVADNTFATPYLQRPLELGCNAVVHSMTKYLNGHGDVVAGAVVSSAAIIEQVKLMGIKDMTGSCISPHDAYLVLRGMKTLELRMERHCANAQRIAQWLQSRPEAVWVRYPGLPGDPHHQRGQRYFPKGAGGILSFGIRGGLEAGRKFIDSLELFALVANVADTRSMVIHPASTTHSQLDEEGLRLAGVSPEGIRVSVGLEDANDLLADLRQALEASQR
jgi:methionine-gamma-lyase